MQEVFEKIIEKLNSKKAYFQRFYECEGKSEHDADLNKSTQLAFDDAIEIVKQEAEKYNNGHFGCNTNGEHEKCNGCGLTDCKNRNKIWFGVSDDNNGWILCSERMPEVPEGIDDDE